jgi:hypothetical protein
VNVRRILPLPLLVTLLLALTGSVPAAAEPAPVAVRLQAVQDVSLPFWCSWGYDWEERCYRDDTERLPIGGDADKVWRAALRFSLATIPSDAVILDAALNARHDATCLGPRRTTRPCAARGYAIDLHPILGPDWFDEREVEIGPAFSRASIPLGTRPEWLTWDLTGLLEEWLTGARANDGVLLKLVEREEDLMVGGPKLPSAAFADPAVRPTLDVVYLPADEG